MTSENRHRSRADALPTIEPIAESELERLIDQALGTEQADAVVVLDHELVVRKVIGPAVPDRGDQLEMVGRPVHEVFAEALGDTVVANEDGAELAPGDRPVARALRDRRDQPRMRLRLVAKDGAVTYRDTWVSYVPVDGDRFALLIGVTDVTDLVRSEHRLRDYVSMTGDMYATVDDDGRFLHLEASHHLDWVDEATAEMADLVHPVDHVTLLELLRDAQQDRRRHSALLRFPSPDGSVLDVAVDVAHAGDDEGIRVVGRDVTDEHRLRQHLEDLAARDPLTGLGNRRFLTDRTPTSLRAEDAVVVVDVDWFKQVNDQYGHAAGDAVLQVMARRLQRACRDQDIVCRLGGDEFVVVVLQPRERLDQLARRFQQATTGPISVGHHTIEVSTSVGAARGAPGLGFDELVAAADDALYQAKRSGRQCWQIADVRTASERTRDRAHSVQ